MSGLELVAGYLVAWGVRKVRRAARRLDDESDVVMDAALDRLHDLVAEKLDGDPALEKLQTEIERGQEPAERLQRRVNDAVADEADADPAFAAALNEALDVLIREYSPQANIQSINASASGAIAQGVIHGNIVNHPGPASTEQP